MEAVNVNSPQAFGNSYLSSSHSISDELKETIKRINIDFPQTEPTQLQNTTKTENPQSKASQAHTQTHAYKSYNLMTTRIKKEKRTGTVTTSWYITHRHRSLYFK
ncbi:late embryogenesis abundant protein [Striga asiatica]|uniref:Late embryogenesis abundant protein n=1 Tax=Striga asiatica TaxID=4170 RepID=A0A5A7PRM6_STRAF|nr:late embryogenesis abundant protein [Striga asiatica]